MKKNIYNIDEPKASLVVPGSEGATNVITATDEQENTMPPAQEFVGGTPDEELLKKMRLSQELREMSTGAPLDRMRDNLRERGVDMLSTETVQSDIVRADNVRKWFDGIHKDDEGYYDLTTARPEANYEHGYYDIEGSVDTRLNERLEQAVNAGYLVARRDEAGNIVAVKETNRKDVSRLIDGAISSTQVPEQMSGRAQSDYFSALTRNIIAQLPTNTKGEIEYNGAPYQWGELYEAIYPVVAERAHNGLIESNRDYFNWAFEQNMGMSYEQWYKEYANNRITEMEKRIIALRDAVAEEAGISAEGAAREMAYSSGTLIPASVMGWAAKHGGEWEASKQFDDVLEEINNFRENGFLSGLDAGFDWLDAVTFGLSDLGTSYSQLSLLEKAKRGEMLSESEKNVLELLEIKQEFDGIKQNLGWKPSIASAVGSGLGTTMEMAAPFGGAMSTTKGIGAVTKLSSGVTTGMAKRAVVKPIGKNLIQNVGTSYARGVVAAPFMPSTYASYFNDLQGQYTIKEDGSVAFKPKNKALAFMGAYIDSMNEIASEYFGSTLGEIMGYGARAFGRVTRLNKIVDAVDNGISKIVDKAISPISDDAKRAATRKVLRGLLVPSADLDSETKEMIQMLGWTDGYVSETFSETFGDFMSQVMRDAIGAEHDYSQFGDADFWITQGLVSTLYGGALNTLGHIKEGVSDYQQIIDLGKVNKRLLDSIESAELRNKLLAIMADGNIDRASQELADLFNEEPGSKPRFHDTDKAKALDFVRSNYTMHTIAGSVEEDSRMKAYLSDVAKITPMVYKGQSTNGIIIEVVADGRTYYVLDGKPADKSESSMLTCVDKETGEKKPIHASAATETSIRGLNEILQEMYTKRFSAHIEAERLASLKSAYEQMEQPSSEVAKSLMEQYGITAPAEGDVITLVDGRNAKVTQDLEDGTYVVRLEGDVPLLFTVPFYNIRSNDAFTAVAQRLMAEGKVVDSVDKAMNIAKAGVENGSITEEAVVAPEQTATETPAAQAEAIARAEVEVANDTLDMTNVPTDAEGNVAYDEIYEPTQFAKVYAHEAGSKQQARTEVAEMRDAAIVKAEQVEAKSKNEITASGKRKALREAKKLRERAEFYNQVLEQLEETEAGFSTIVDNEYSRQIAEPTKRVVDAMAKKLGLKKVRFVESVNGGKANAQIKGDVVEIAFMERDSSIAFLMGHEFTHRMQDLSPQAYAEFKQMVKEYVGEEAWTKEFERVKALYAVRGIAISDEALEDELTADMAGALVEQRDVFLDYLEGKKHDKTFIEKVRDILQELASFFNGVGDDEREKKILGMIDSLNNLIADAEAPKVQTAKAESAENTEAKFSLREVNNRFNEELATLTEENARERILNVGTPSSILLACGIEDKPIRLYGAKLLSKVRKHGYNIEDLKDLPLAMSSPIAVFNGSKPDSFAILTELRIGDNNVLAALSVGKGGHDVDFNIISSVYDKREDSVARWVNDGKMLWVDKKKALDYFSVSAPLAEAQNNQELISTTKVIQNFENPNIEPQFSLRELDAPYLDAVERGDMETAQRMVLEAAKLAMPDTKVVDENGNPKVVYHQTNASVYINRETGQNWDELDWRERMEWDERDDWDDYWEEREFNTFSRVNARTTNEFDGFFFAPNYDEYHEYGDRTIAAFLNIANPASNADYNIDSSKNNAGREERLRLQQEGYDGVIREYDGEVNEYIAFEPNQIKSADPVTYDDNGNVIPLSERFNLKKEDIRYSLRQPIFYSNAEYAVRGIKQEKATPEQWLKMIEKNGGLKAGEDKWLGLSDWLKASDKKTLTKDEVLQYIAENDIQIEEVQYSETNTELLDRVGELTNDLYYIDESINSLSESIAKGKQRLKTLTDAKRVFDEKAEALKQEYGEDSPEYQNHIFYDSYTDDIESLEASIAQDEEYYNTQSERADAIRTEMEVLNAEFGDERGINETRLDYTTKGLGNKREIALVVPTIEPWNTSDNIHFGDAGEGRAVAWIRFGETTDADDKRVLVIDEIQSKRHQEGREKGYRDVEAEKREKAERERELTEVVLPRIAELNQLYNEKYGENNWWDTDYDEHWHPQRVYRFLTPEEQTEYEQLSQRATELQAPMPRRNGVPSAPFEKNWAELAMKRMLRYAAENGFDKVAWTTGDQQAERYNIGNVVTRILSYDAQVDENEVKHIELHLTDRSRRRMAVDANGIVVSSEGDFVKAGTPFADVVGKEVARKVLDGEGEDATLVLRDSKDGVADAMMQMMQKYGVSRPVDLNAVISAEDKAVLDAYNTQREVTAKEIDGDGLRIGGEGMKAFYDQMLPSFVRKYAKKWGATIGEVTMPDLEENNTMHAVDVTPAMRESVMQGQPKFSLRGSDKSLVGLHNISLDKLRKAIKMGGLANPSVAVIDVDKATHEDYGDYTLVLTSNMVDARLGRNAGTWAGDAWTPTYPQVVKRIAMSKDITRFYKDINKMPEAMRNRVSLQLNSFLEDRPADSFAYWYLFEKGVAPEMAVIPPVFPDNIVKMVSEATDGTFNMWQKSDEQKARCVDAYIAYKYDGDRAEYEADLQNRKERLQRALNTTKSQLVAKKAAGDLAALEEFGFDYDAVSTFLREVETDNSRRGHTDVQGTIRLAEEYIKDNNLEEDYQSWRDSLEGRYGVKEYIFDGYTDSGNQRWLPHTTANASKWMKKQGREGATGTFPSFGLFVATVIPRMTTLNTISKRKGHLGRPEQEYEAFKEKWESVYFELGQKLQPDADRFEDYGWWRLIEAVSTNNPKEHIKKEYGIELADEDMQKLNDMLDAIKTNYPARYFETKFERPVELSEFIAAVVPNNIPADVEASLKDAYLNVYKYDKDVEGSRQDAVLEATDSPSVRFSMRLPKAEYASLSSIIMTRQHTYGRPPFDYAFTFDNFYVYDYLGDGVNLINFAMPIVGNEDLIRNFTTSIDNGTITDTRGFNLYAENLQGKQRTDYRRFANAFKKRYGSRGYGVAVGGNTTSNGGAYLENSTRVSGDATPRGTSRNTDESTNRGLKTQYSVRQELSEEEAYKASLLEEAMRMEREATSAGADIAQEIADRTGWVHLADGNWKFYGEGKLDITKQASVERAAFRWLESKKAIKVVQIHKVYDPLIRDAGKIVDEINRSQKADYVKLKKYADKVEYILQGNAIESLPIEDQVLADIALGQRLKWSDGDGKRGLKTELGLDSAKREKMGAVTSFAREYLEDYVARLMERNNGYEKGLDDNDIRNAVIEVFSSYPSPKAALEELYARYEPEADVTEAMDGLNRLEFERDNALAEVEAEYREIFEDFDKNPDKYVREHQASEAYNANLDMYVGTLGKVRKEVERLERNAKNRKLSDEEKASAMRAVKSAIAKELRDGLGRFTRKYDIQRMMDAVNDARTPYAMLRAIDKAMESLFEIKWRREFARMQSLTKAKLTYGVTTTDPSTFLNTFVSDHKITAADARKIMNDYWRGTKANGVSVAKYIDDTTRQAIEFISQFLEYGDAVATFKGLPTTSIDDFARNLREKLENYTELANRKMKAMLANDEVRKAIIDSVDILALYWKAQELQLTLNDDKHLRDINALELKVKDITAQLSEVNKQIKALADNKVVVTKSGVKDKDTLLRELQEEYNALLAERMEAYAEMYSAMPDIIKLMSDANNAVERLLRTGRVNLSIERTKRREHEKELIADALADLASPESPFKDTRDFNSNRTWKNIKAAIGNTVGAPLGSMDYMLRKMGRNAPMGEGRLYNRFAYAFQEAYDNIYVGIAQRKKMLDDKCNELWSKKYTDIQKNAEKTKVATISYKTARANAKGEVVYIEKSADVYVTQAMYILAMWNQVDGRKALERQSFNEEKIAFIREALDRIDPRWNEFAEWVINEYLPSGREKYNAVHRATFGTSMAFVPNYFPIKRAKEKIQKTEDVAKNDADLLPSTVVGAIKERTSNVVPIDVSTSFFEALNENTTVMEAWAEMVSIIEDINKLLSNGAVKTTMEDISPSLFKDFKKAAQVATLSYIGKTPDIDKNLGTILNRLWAGSKIAFRLNTAFKQLSSAILFAGYDPDPKFQAMLLWRFVGGVGKAPTSMLNSIISGASMLTGTTFTKIDVMTNIEWARTHLPSFAKRWEEGVAGNELMARTTSGNTPWNQRKWHVKFDDAVREVTKFGMKPNAFVDAFTSAAGARAVYDYAYEAFLKDGYSEEEAHRLAIIRAEMSFNTTQQSSEGLYLSPLQNDRSFLSTSLSTFMNAPYAMYRNSMISIDEILRNAKKELREIEAMEYDRYMSAARKAIDKQVAEEVERGVYEEGADAEQRKADLIEGAKEYITPRAQAAAKRKLRKAKVKAVVTLALNGYAGQLAFNLMGKLADLLLGDDDEEKKRTLYDMATNSLWEAPLSMIPLGGQVITPLINGYEPSMFPSAGETFKDMEKIAKELREEGFNDEAINIAVKLALRSGLGINLDTITNIALGIDSMIEDGMSVEAILKVINAPEKQIRNYVLQRREGETVKEYTERIMRFYSILETPIYEDYFNEKDGKRKGEEAPFGMTQKDMDRIKWEDAYRRDVVLHYGDGKQLAEIEATRKAYRKTKSDGYGDMHEAKKERLSLITSKINDTEKQLKRIVDDSLYYERLQVVTNLQKKYIELYEQFK